MINEPADMTTSDTDPFMDAYGGEASAPVDYELQSLSQGSDITDSEDDGSFCYQEQT